MTLQIAARLAAVTLALTLTAASQQTPPVQLTAAQDHQRLMDLLGITALRPGPTPTPNRPNTANYDESKANPYPSLPDPLILNNGKRVTTPKIWWTKRRPELVEIFDREIFGRVPANTPKVTWQVIATNHETQANIPVITKHLIGHVDNSAYPLITVDIRLTLTTPANAPGAVPVILEFTFENYPQPNRRDGTPQPPMPADPNAQWKQDLIRKGWGYALLEPTSIQADNGAGLTHGIIGLCNHGQPRKLDGWGALRAWAWGGSRALDYLATDKSVDAKQVGVAGHSRFGKTALVAMAYDQRFAIAYVSSSGAGGANLARRHFGEQLENIAATGEYHWMAGNYIKVCRPDSQRNSRHGNARRHPRADRPLRSTPSLHRRRHHRRRRLGRRPRHLPRRSSRRPRLQTPRRKRPRHHHLPTDRNPTHHRRPRLPPTLRRPHPDPQLAHLHRLRQPLPPQPFALKIYQSLIIFPSNCGALGYPAKSLLPTMTFYPATAFLLFPIMIVMALLGRHLRGRRSDAIISATTEGAVFALFGLLLAFTFSGAVARYDDHRKLIVEEANDIGTAYRRLDLLPAAAQPALRQDFRDYAVVDEHRFDEVPENPQSIKTAEQADRLEDQIWSRSVAAASSPGANVDATKLLLPALNAMIDMTATRKNSYNLHPPSIIFLLLYIFSAVCAYMAGYSMEPGRHHWLYTLSLALTVTLTVYATLEVEYPRLGLIHLTTQNEVFFDLINTMK